MKLMLNELCTLENVQRWKISLRVFKMLKLFEFSLRYTTETLLNSFNKKKIWWTISERKKCWKKN